MGLYGVSYDPWTDRMMEMLRAELMTPNKAIRLVLVILDQEGEVGALDAVLEEMEIEFEDLGLCQKCKRNFWMCPECGAKSCGLDACPCL